MQEVLHPRYNRGASRLWPPPAGNRIGLPFAEKALAALLLLAHIHRAQSPGFLSVRVGGFGGDFGMYKNEVS